MEHRFKTTFTSTASVYTPSEDQRKTAVASLDKLRQLLPAGVDPEMDPDLLYIACDGAVAGLANRNLDGITKETAIAIHRSATNKYVNAEHDRKEVVGVVLYPALTHRDTHEILTDEEAAASVEPFNMSFAGVLWRTVSPMLSKYIAQQGTSTGKDVLSMSWEIAFSQYSIGVGNRDMGQAKIVPESDASFATYDKLLRQNGGEGKDSSGQEVYRIIAGDAIVLGFGIVPNPAAEVKGIVAIEKTEQQVEAALLNINAIFKLTDEKLSSFAQTLFEVARQRGITFEAATSAAKDLSITPPNVSVTLNTAPSMKIETVEQLESALGKHEATAAAVDFVKAIKEASEQFAKDLKAKDEVVANAELAKAENEKRAAKLQASLDEVKKELAEVRASQEAAEIAQKFQERMASFDEEFDLDDEDRSILAAQIKDLDDTQFETFAKSCKKLMAGKSKSAKKANPFKKGEKPGDKKDDKEPDDDGDDSKASLDVKAALASVTEDKGQAKLPNTTQIDEDLKSRTAAAFGSSIKIDGETITERQAARAAKKSKK